MFPLVDCFLLLLSVFLALFSSTFHPPSLPFFWPLTAATGSWLLTRDPCLLQWKLGLLTTGSSEKSSFFFFLIAVFIFHDLDRRKARLTLLVSWLSLSSLPATSLLLPLFSTLPCPSFPCSPYPATSFSLNLGRFLSFIPHRISQMF